jgi:hypothetical protein
MICPLLGRKKKVVETLLGMIRKNFNARLTQIFFFFCLMNNYNRKE